MNCHHFSRHRDAQGGAALIVALLIFALCTALIVAMKSEFELYYQRGANAAISEQIYAYLRGAEELASLALMLDYDQDLLADQPRDDLSELWAQARDPLPLDEGGWWHGELEDLQGRFNLNTLGGSTSSNEGEGRVGAKFTTVQQRFIRLLSALESPQVSEQDAILITESIADWLDSDSQPRLHGAEDDYYAAQTPSYRAANRSMSSASELRLVAYVTAEIYEALRPWITALPDTKSHLNILTAPAILLRTINTDNKLQALSEADGEILAEYRTGIESVDDFLKHEVFSGDPPATMNEQLGVTSNYFLLSASAKVADRTLRLYSVMERQGRSVVAIARASGDL